VPIDVDAIQAQLAGLLAQINAFLSLLSQQLANLQGGAADVKKLTSNAAVKYDLYSTELYLYCIPVLYMPPIAWRRPRRQPPPSSYRLVIQLPLIYVLSCTVLYTRVHPPMYLLPLCGCAGQGGC